MKLAVMLLAAAAPAAALAATAPAKPYDGHELAPQAQVQLAQAETIALKARPGRIIDRELEREGGGSGLRWSFDVRASSKTYEVGVDAKTGKVLENRVEGSHPD